MIKKTLLVTMTLWGGVCESAVMEVSSWDAVLAGGTAALVSANVSEGDVLRSSMSITYYAGTCGATITYIQPTPPKRVWYTYATLQNNPTCWGASPGKWTQAEMPAVFNQPKNGLRLSASSTVPSSFVPTKCEVRQEFNWQSSNGLVPGWGWSATASQSECRMQPAVVQCAIIIPSVIQHRVAGAGVVKSVAEINAAISCNRVTNVRVTVPRNVVLAQGNKKITTAVSLGGVGSSIITVPNPTTNFQITSTIDATDAAPGAYSGSFVLLAEWD